MEPLMKLINAMSELTLALQQLTEKMSSEYISTFEEISVVSEDNNLPEPVCRQAGPVQEEPPITRADVRAKLAELTRLGFSDEVKELLQKHGAERFSAVDDAELPALMKEAETIGT